ncbi:MAG: HD domain-containing protein [Mogibacterium sp.]|nr:HD domain-containing protein [Mogibacterium sp.]
MSITKEIQQEMFRDCGTPEHVQLHCNEVARVAKKIAEALNRNGYHLDVDRIYGAALVHDVLRVEREHDRVGAEYLIAHGYPEEAELVRHHMKYYPFSEIEDLKEIDILCLADRTVREHEFVGIDLRMDYLLQKPGFPAEKKPYIEEARQKGRAFIHAVEGKIGMPLEELMKE